MVCNIRMASIFNAYRYGITLFIFILLFFMVPGIAFSESGTQSVMVTASELKPVIEAPKIQPSGEAASTGSAKSAAISEIRSRKAEPKKADPEISQNRPLSINIDPEDKRAHLAIEESLRMFTQSIKPRFSMWLERSGRYIEIMQGILKERNMPTELVFLPIVESGFNPKAYSKARAAGPWQFISATAKRYGLVIDWWKDERKDPVKSTIAASKYLRDLYNMFGSWSLALAAYNAGEGRISKALKRSNSEDYWALLSTSQIRQETKDYVPRYIAATMIANTPEEYGFDNLDYHEPFEYDEVVVYKPVDLEIIAQCSGSSVDTIRELNPELRRWSTPPNVGEYTLRIPPGRADVFVEKISKIPDNKLLSYDRYIVKKSDNIKKIAAKTKVPVSVILELNSLAGIERLSSGEVIKLPPHGKYSADIDDKMTALKAAKESRSKKKCVVKGKKGKKRYVACGDKDDEKMIAKESRSKKKCVVKGKKGKKRYVACGDKDDEKMIAKESRSKKKCVVKGKKGKKRYVACGDDDDNQAAGKYAGGKKGSKKHVASNDDNKAGKKNVVSKKDKKAGHKNIAGKDKKSNDSHARVKSKKANNKQAATSGNKKVKNTSMKSGKRNGSRA
jgi:membrane-bound lytic murein transglycosylase D